MKILQKFRVFNVLWIGASELSGLTQRIWKYLQLSFREEKEETQEEGFCPFLGVPSKSKRREVCIFRNVWSTIFGQPAPVWQRRNMTKLQSFVCERNF